MTNENEVPNDDELEKQLEASLAVVRERKRVAAELERKRIEDKKLEELKNKPTTINVRGIVGGLIITQSDYREDLLELWRNIPDRTYRDGGQNGIPLKEWPATLDKLVKLPNINIVYMGTAESDIKNIYAPPFEVKMDAKTFLVTKNPRSYSHKLLAIPGLIVQSGTNIYKIPFSEGWRLWDALKDYEGTVFTDEARSFIIEQMERRAKLDETAALLDVDFPITLAPGMQLHPYQKVGAKFAVDAGGRVIIGDEMGLGKTPEAIAVCEYYHQEDLKKWNNLIHNSTDIYRPGKNIIICPASLKINWMRQIKKFTGEIASVLSGTTPTKEMFADILLSRARYFIINYDIIGRKFDYVTETKDLEGFTHRKEEERWPWIEMINFINPECVVVDEAHYIKNDDSARSKAVRKLKAAHVIMLTGTPIINRPPELWPMLTVLSPEVFPSKERFVRQYTYDGKQPRNTAELHQLMRPLMIRRLKKDVIKDLPPINRIVEPHELSDRARKLYQKVESGVFEKIAEYSAKGSHGGTQDITNILVQIQRLKQVCAIDKTERTADLATELADSMEDEANNKVLIFSQFKATAFAIHRRLQDQGALTFVTLGRSDFKTADDRERDNLVQQFQNDPAIKYLVVTEKTAKEGHDITKAGAVIFNDLFWTPAGHAQGEGRAYGRMDNPHSINSYYVVTEQSIDEWIWELLEQKMKIIEEVVDGVEKSRDASIANDLIEKIKQMMWRR
jgi:SNF2 family DNA or RNA helicase